jgi:sucrose-6-phosphate hydrolase SacC (GH32 family)
MAKFFLSPGNMTLLICTLLCFSGELLAQTQEKIPDAPLFRDPVHDGSADPTVFYNHEEKKWWMVYTQRRANVKTHNLSWVHGTAIGAASSDDGGISWKYRGTLDLDYEPGHNTYWAPDVFWEDGKYHFFVSFVQGIPTDDYMDEHKILLYEGRDMWDLKFTRQIDLQSDRVIDPTVIKLPDGSYRMWYKHENAGYTTHYADSKDLVKWKPQGQAIDSAKCEGANAFYWKDKYWMITDPWKGIELFKSPDAKTWEREGMILEGIGQRPEDSAKGHHACVVPSGEYAYIFYHCNPEESFGTTTSWATIGYRQRRSVIQVARLRMEDGKVVCDRDKPFALELPEMP